MVRVSGGGKGRRGLPARIPSGRIQRRENHSYHEKRTDQGSGRAGRRIRCVSLAIRRMQVWVLQVCLRLSSVHPGFSPAHRALA